MYTFWLQRWLAINRAGTEIVFDWYDRWLQLARYGAFRRQSRASEPWIEQVVRHGELCRQASPRPRLVNCAAGYYSCCSFNLGVLYPVNDPVWANRSLEA
ncbi:hypothetical protein CAI21_03560 [Alkalilimnicola ehrlichii]|uniref:Uncharacterized protein n=1 Tax=Alkalilimnicola ehrlichii TaxID=351052 RepID=A0A3E0X2Z8_9GAMM|nr:hypothetical protein [Alkalilimnicola ehrlichii]RFA31054.1 hypothetical protein CAI21_03560 [Alkalilimnicola ehrlichii]RFA39011.1 hypothetical protein CAL65_03715 [Alkalilimnicola ehrlichii]